MNYLTELQKYSKCLDSDFFDDNDFNIEDFKKFDSNVLNIIQIFNDVVTKFNISNERMNSINLLIEKYNSNVIDNNSDNPIVDYIKKISFTTEIFNGIAHVFQDAQKDISKEKKKQLNDYESFYFEYKKQMIEKIAKHGIDKSENGIICGNIIDNNENITKNKNVFVVDIPTVGQLSWHITDITKNNLSETYGLKEYKYEIQKDTEDFRKSGTELNSKLLLEKYTDTRNTHNELVTYIPEGCEDELELALDLYYEVKNNPNKYEHPEKIIRQACYARGKVPSRMTFKKILTYVLGNNNYEYDEKDMMKWRDNYERELEERDNN